MKKILTTLLLLFSDFTTDVLVTQLRHIFGSALAMKEQINTLLLRCSLFPKLLLALGILLSSSTLKAQNPAVPANNVRYYFKNTSDVNEKSYTDEEIFINVMYPMPGMYGFFDGRTQSWQDVSTAGTYTWPDGTTGRNVNATLGDLPIDNTGNYYIDMPPSPAGGSEDLYWLWTACLPSR